MIETAIIVAVLIGVVQALKTVGLSSKFAPVTAIVLGVITVGFLNGFNALNVFEGVIAGLTAAGLYSGTKATLK